MAVQVMSIICTLSLRSPDNAARAVEAGAGDLAIQSMQKFPGAHLLQKNSCLMIRNLVVRNPENRYDFLNLLSVKKFVATVVATSLSLSLSHTHTPQSRERDGSSMLQLQVLE